MPEEMLLEDAVDSEVDVSGALAEEVKRFSEMHLRLKTQLEAAEEELRAAKSAAEKASIERKDLKMNLIVAKDEGKTKDAEAKDKIAELQKLLADVQQVEMMRIERKQRILRKLRCKKIENTKREEGTKRMVGKILEEIMEKISTVVDDGEDKEHHQPDLQHHQLPLPNIQLHQT